MKDLQRLATAAPGSLVFDPAFWRSHRSYIAVVAGGVAFMTVLAPLTYQSGDWIWFTVLIQLLVLWGMAIGARALAHLDVDDAIARLVGERASTELGRLKGGLQDRILLDRVETDFLPHNPSHDKGVLRVFRHILAEARDRKFQDATTLVQPFRDDCLGDLLRVQTAQRIAMHLGILGTFAGLIQAMGKLTELEKNLLEPEALKALFQALHISFSTSIAGLEVAIILAMTLLVLRRRHEELFREVEEASAALIALARNSIVQDEFLVELGQTRTALMQVGDRVREQAREVEVQTEQIRVGLGRLLELRHDFDTFLERIREEQGVVLSEMKSVYQVISPQQTAEELRQSLGEANRLLLKSFREELGQCLAEIGQVNETLRLAKELAAQAERSQSESEEVLNASRATLEKGAKEIVQAIASLQGQLSSTLNRQAQSESRPAPSTPPSPVTLTLPPEGMQSLERIAKTFENLSRRMERNNSVLEELNRTHLFYQSLLRKPRTWWELLRKVLTRRIEFRRGEA